MTELRQTPLYSLQKQRGGRFVPFAGWEMPVQFAGVVAEHQAVRERCGLFDVSHMGEVTVTGPQAQTALQHLVTNDVSRIGDGQALYTVMCVADGGIVDDLIIYREAAERYFLCINAGRRADDVAHITQQLEGFACTVTDVSDQYAQLALQGPHATAILTALTAHDVGAMKAFTFVDAMVAQLPHVRIACTGYTGEHGYELYCAPAQAPQLWQALEQAGAPHGLALCGLGARDTLRLEMKYPLYGNDIDLQHNPLEAGLGWVVKLQKGPFVGAEALRQIKQAGPARAWVGFTMRERGIPRQGYPIWSDGVEVGVVTSGTHSPTLGEPVGCGYVPKKMATIGTPLHIMIRNNLVAAQVVKTPFLKREHP